METLTIAEKKKLVKANAAKLNIKVSEVNAMPEAHLDELIAKIQGETAPAEVTAEQVKEALVSDGTFTNEKGDIIPIVNAVFVRVTGGGGFAFAFGADTIISNDNDIRFLFGKGKLVPGDVVAFRPDTIEYNSMLNAYTGQPNKSATPSLLKVVEFRNSNKAVNQGMEAELRARGLNGTAARNVVQDQIARDVMSTFKRPTFEL